MEKIITLALVRSAQKLSRADQNVAEGGSAAVRSAGCKRPPIPSTVAFSLRHVRTEWLRKARPAPPRKWDVRRPTPLLHGTRLPVAPRCHAIDFPASPLPSTTAS